MSHDPTKSETADQLDLDLDSFFEDEAEFKAATANLSLTSRMSSLGNGQQFEQSQYTDIETVPDDDRAHLFGLPEIPPTPTERPFDDCPLVADVVKWDVAKLKDQLPAMNPCHQWIEALKEAEVVATEGKKGPRAGLAEAIKGIFAGREKSGGMLEKQRKDMGLSPLMNRIVSLAMAFGQGEIQCEVVGEHDDRNERDLLDWFWESAKKSQPIITWNGNDFDLPVIFMRSILLGVTPSRTIDRSRYRQDSLDLQVVFYNGKIPPKGRGQKWVCRCMGIEVPAEGVDGSQVEAMWSDPSRHAELAEYNKSDVWCLRELHGKLLGTFVI